MRRSLQLFLLLCVGGSSASCTTATPRNGPARSLRPTEQCFAAIDSAAAGLIAVQPPKPRDIRLPPRAPDALRGQLATLSFHVDTAGRVVGDRIEVKGIADQTFASRLREHAKSFTFWPATANQCAVPGTTDLVFEF